MKASLPLTGVSHFLNISVVNNYGIGRYGSKNMKIPIFVPKLRNGSLNSYIAPAPKALIIIGFEIFLRLYSGLITGILQLHFTGFGILALIALIAVKITC